MKTKQWAVAALVACSAGAYWWWAGAAAPGATANATSLGTGTDAQPASGGTQPTAGAGALQAAASGGTPLSAQGQQARRIQLEIWRQRYDRAEQVYSSYKESTRYPPDSRPISQHPDQVRPFAPILDDKPLRNPGGQATGGVRLRTTQERVFLSGQESTLLTVTGVDEEGKPTPITITRAIAINMPNGKNPGLKLQTALQFSDTGGEADAQAGDGVFSARLQPATQGFSQFDGGIRVQLEVRHSGNTGQLAFDVVYASGVPATWGAVSESLQAGSLYFNLKAQVRQAGRYVVSARVDDANGTPFALVSFNDQVGEGAQTFRLQLHGILLHDLQPAFPLRLRDVEGFILYPDRFPDRAMMPRLPGVVHTTNTYPLTAFSNQEWTSEERERYLAEYGRDLDQAREQLRRLQPP